VELRTLAAGAASLPVQLIPGQPQLTTPLNVQSQRNASSGFVTQVACDKTFILNGFSTSGSTQEVAGVSGKNIYVCGWEVNSASTVSVTVKLQAGTGTNCATGTADMSQQVPLQALSANAPVGSVQMPPSNVLWATNATGVGVASSALCVNLSTANSVNLQVWYAQF
jgi:hypothetical protein